MCACVNKHDTLRVACVFAKHMLLAGLYVPGAYFTTVVPAGKRNTARQHRHTYMHARSVCQCTAKVKHNNIPNTNIHDRSACRQGAYIIHKHACMQLHGMAADSRRLAYENCV